MTSKYLFETSTDTFYTTRMLTPLEREALMRFRYWTWRERLWWRLRYFWARLRELEE